MDYRENRIQSAKLGLNPMVIMELEASFVAIGDTQFLEGYCVLLPKEEYASLNDMPLKIRTQFLKEMSMVGDALLQVLNPLRINYDILCNTDNFLHAHIFPRYESESEERRKMPVWLYDQSFWVDEKYAYSDDKHGGMREAIRRELEKLRE